MADYPIANYFEQPIDNEQLPQRRQNMTTQKPMSHAQRQYALERVRSISRDLHDAADKKYETVLTVSQLIAGIKSGKLKRIAKETDAVDRYDRVSSLFDIERKPDPKLAAVRKAINEQEQRARDEIMLGDADAGMKILAALEAFKV